MIKNQEELDGYIKELTAYFEGERKKHFTAADGKEKEIAIKIKSITEKAIEEKARLENVIKEETEKSRKLTEEGKKNKQAKKERVETLKDRIERLESNKERNKKEQQELNTLKEEYGVAEEEYKKVKSYSSTETIELGRAERALDACEVELNRIKNYVGNGFGEYSRSKYIDEKYPDIAKLQDERDEFLNSVPTIPALISEDYKKDVKFYMESEESKAPRYDLNEIEYASKSSALGVKTTIALDSNGKFDWSIEQNKTNANVSFFGAEVLKIFPDALETMPMATLKSAPKAMFKKFEVGLNPVTYDKTVDKAKYPTFEAWKESMEAMKKAKESQLQQYIKEQEEKNQQGMQ